MQTLIYKKINSNFTFENISLHLTKFWSNEAIKSGYSKIWLTLTVDTIDNRSFTIIKNLPFNTVDYTDVTIVLKQLLSSYFFRAKQKRYTIKNIILKYHFENKFKPDSILKRLLSTPFERHTRKDYIKLAGIYTILSMRETKTPYLAPYKINKKRLFMAIIFMLGLFLILVTMIILYLEISLFKSEFLNADIFKPCTFVDYEIEKNMGLNASKAFYSTSGVSINGCIFKPFITWFNLTGYCPNSYSMPNNFISTNLFGEESVKINHFCLGEYIIYHEFYKTFILQDYINGLEEFSKVFK